MKKLEKLVKNVLASLLVVSAISFACLSSVFDGAEYVCILLATFFMSGGIYMFKEFFKGGE